MARIAGIDLPKNKRGEIGLTYIFGIGRSSAQRILSKAGISFDKKVNEWNDEESNAIRKIINDEIKVRYPKNLIKYRKLKEEVEKVINDYSNQQQPLQRQMLKKELLR